MAGCGWFACSMLVGLLDCSNAFVCVVAGFGFVGLCSANKTKNRKKIEKSSKSIRVLKSDLNDHFSYLLITGPSWSKIGTS